MAAKTTHKINLSLGFNLEKESLEKAQRQISDIAEKGFSSGKGKDYFKSLTLDVNNFSKEFNSIIKQLNKPLSSGNQAKQIFGNFEAGIERLDRQVLSLQGNLTRTLNSAGNVDALQQIKQLGKEIDNLLSVSQKLSEIRGKNNVIGSKESINAEIKAQKDILKTLQTDGKLTKEQNAQKKQALKIIDEENAKLKQKNELTEQYNALLQKTGYSSKEGLDSGIREKISEQNSIQEGSLSLQEGTTLKTLLDDIRQLISAIRQAAGLTSQEIVEEVDQQNREFEEAEARAKNFKTILQSLGIGFSLDWVIRQLKDIVRYSYDYIKNLDAALTEISIVSGKSRKEVGALTDTFIDLSAKTGMAIDDIAQASTIFYQQGLDDKAVAKLTEYTAIFAKISGETVETASNQITAAINGFSFAADEAGKVIDKLSVLAAYSAADINELATAMSKGAAQANQAGLTFDEYNAYLATMIEATREAPENIGTSMKTIISRIQQIKTGDNTEDDTDVNDVEKALKTVNIQLRDTDGQLKDLDEILGELGPKWANLDRNTQAYLGTIIAGTRQQSRFITLMQNWDRVLELTEASENSNGAATEMHAAAMQGLEASLNNLTNAWQKLISNLLKGDDFKVIIDTLTGIVKWFAKGHSGLKLFSLAMVVLNTKTLATNISLGKQNEKYKNLDETVRDIVEVFGREKTALANLAADQDAEIQRMVTKNSLLREEVGLLKERNAEQGKGPVTPIQTPQTDIPTPSLPTSNTETPLSPSNTGKPTTFKGKLKNFGKGTKNVFSNAGQMLGKIQTAITVGTAAASFATHIVDVVQTTGDEIREKFEEEYEKTQESIDKYTKVIDTADGAGKVYDELSKKVNKSSDEIERLAEATNELAETIPQAIVGYDKEMNAIIDTNIAREKASEAEKNRAEEAKKQMGNIGGLSLADIKTSAEEKVAAEHSYDTAQELETWGIGIGTGVALGVAGTNFWNPVGWAALVFAGISALALHITTELENDAIEAEEYAAALKKADEIQAEYQDDLLQNMQYITDYNIANKKVAGVSEGERTSLANYIGNSFLTDRTSELRNQLATQQIDEEEFTEAFKNLGQEWEDILKKIDDKTLASAYKAITAAQDGIGDKTYDTIEKEITKIINSDMGIKDTDPLFKTVKNALLNAVYSGTEGGIVQVIKELEARRDQAPEEDKAKYNTAITSAKQMSNNELGFYSALGLTDDVNFFNDFISKYSNTIKTALSKGTQQAAMEAIVILQRYKNTAEQELDRFAKDRGYNSYEEIDSSKLTEGAELDKYNELINKLNASTDSLEMAWRQLPESIEPTWAQLFEMFEGFTERVETARKTLAEIKEDGGITYDEWKNFATLFDDIDTSGFSTEQLEDYSAALDTIADNMVLVNGELQLNKKGIETVANLEEVLADAEINGVKAQLEGKKATMEAQRDMIQADIDYMNVQKVVLESIINGTYDEAKANADLDDAKQKFNENAAKLLETFQSNEYNAATNYAATWTTAFDTVAKEYNQLVTAMTNHKEADTTVVKNIGNTLIADLKPTTDGLWDFSNMSVEQAKKALSDLNNKIEAANHVLKEYELGISNINMKLATLASGLKKTNEAFDKGSKAVEEYISKLEKLLNILRHIEREEANLKIAETLKDMQTGKSVIDRLDDEIRYATHLQDDYAELKQKYEDEANDAAKDIRKGFGDIVTFDAWGNYEVDMDKYNKLSDKEKKLLDESLESYDDIIDKRDDSYGKYLDYLKKEIDAEQEKVDKYIKAEDTLVEAIKTREQKILDAKLAAIDKEIDAIQKLSEARTKAREEENDAEELSSLQTDLQRAMMDSSGASASQILQIQKQIKDKQQEMADNSFNDMVDDLTQQLEDEKEAEQQLFDERLEEMDWYWNEVNRIMDEGTDSVLDIMRTYSEEYNQQSEIQQAETLKGWTDTFEQAIAIGRDKIPELQDLISDLQDTIDQLVVDEDILTDDTINTGFDNRPKTSSDSNKPSGGKKGGKNTPKPQTTSNPTSETILTPAKFVVEIRDYDNTIIRKQTGEVGKTITISLSKLADKNGWEHYDWDLPNGSCMTRASGSYKASEAGIIKAMRRKKTTSITPPAIGNRNDGMSHNTTIPTRFATGGMNYTTGLAWLDGTRTNPEAVLNAVQTKAFLQFTDDLTALRAEGAGLNSSVLIDTISFNVASMSSVEDGEIAFNAFVDKFKEIGAKTGISIKGTSNQL